MIVNCTDPDISPETNRHYIGLAKYFRAFFYFEKVKRYGEVPWFGKPIDVDDDDLLYGPRDPRTLVMDSVLADLNYAIEHIATAEDNTRSLVTKSVATALKARVCLFEGTFRKYHTELGHIIRNWVLKALPIPGSRRLNLLQKRSRVRGYSALIPAKESIGRTGKYLQVINRLPRRSFRL